MANLQNASKTQKLLVTNPFTNQNVDVLPLFALLHLRHESIDGPDNFSTLARMLLEAVSELNAEAAQSKANVAAIAESNCTLSQLALTFLDMRNQP